MTYQKKKIMLILGMMVICYMAYQLSFKQALTAFMLSKELQKEKVGVSNFDSSFPQVSKANAFYLSALKGYNVKQEDRENRLWQSVSGMAIANDVSISFAPNLTLVSDTLTIRKGIINEFTFKANYFSIVKLIDTISRSKEIGKISYLKLSSKKDAEKGKDELTLNLSLVGLER
jgi:hypothetical protein